MKKQKTITAALLIVCLAVGLTAFKNDKREYPSFLATTLPMLEAAKTHVLEVLDAMPEDKFDYKPDDKSKSFRDCRGISNRPR